MKNIIKYDCYGNPIILQGNHLWFLRKENGELFKVVHCPTIESARKEFARYYRKPAPKRRPKAQARVYYSQLIITC